MKLKTVSNNNNKLKEEYILFSLTYISVSIQVQKKTEIKFMNSNHNQQFLKKINCIYLLIKKEL